MSEYWTTEGNVRGSCDHRHRTIEAAVRCENKDARACRSLGGGAYSDRSIRHYVDGQAVPLTDDERAIISELED